MTITAQDILTTLGQRAWSGFNADDMVFDSEDSNQAKAELNSALRYLINLEDFPFRAKNQNIMAINNIAEYPAPVGQITEIYNADTLKSLKYIGDGNRKSKTKKGEPTQFWITPNNPSSKIRLFPTPDKQYNFTVVYNQFKPVMTAKGETLFEFENPDDIINMPSNLEHLFKDCLVLRTMAQNNKDEQDENYQPTLNEFAECWRLFKRACQPTRVGTRIIW